MGLHLLVVALFALTVNAVTEFGKITVESVGTGGVFRRRALPRANGYDTDPRNYPTNLLSRWNGGTPIPGTCNSSECTSNPGKIVFAPGGNSRVLLMTQKSPGTYDAWDFNLMYKGERDLDTASLQAFAGAAYIPAQQKVIFAPYHADYVGIFNTATDAYSSFSIPSTTAMKYNGATLCGGSVWFAPAKEDRWARVDAQASITTAYPNPNWHTYGGDNNDGGITKHSSLSGQDYKYDGAACVVPSTMINGNSGAVTDRAVFAPHNYQTHLGIIETATNVFSTVSLGACGTLGAARPSSTSY